MDDPNHTDTKLQNSVSFYVSSKIHVYEEKSIKCHIGFSIFRFWGTKISKKSWGKNKKHPCPKTLHPIRQDHQTAVFRSNRPNLPWSTEAFLVAFQMRPKPRTAAMMKNVIHFSLVFSLNKCGAFFHLFGGEGNVHIKNKPKSNIFKVKQWVFCWM